VTTSLAGTVVALAAAIVVACATSAPVTPTPSAPAPTPAGSPGATGSPSVSPTAAAVTWKEYSVAKPEPFRVALPDTWQAIDAAQLADDETLVKLEQQNPALAGILRASIEQMRSGGISFVAIEPSSISSTRPFADNLNVVPPSGQVTSAQWDEYVRQSTASVRDALKLPQPPPANTVLLPNASRAVELIYTYELAMPTGEKLTVAVQQYLILSGSKPFVLSMSTTQDQQATRRDLFNEIAKRFRPG
jgi:hypothetical protein